ncbi:ESPR-type extended signal peptide-containing protein, partial [Haemophilus parahaemolyticus]|uniref:ESPR-type extended signal peptide-containing protein n=2 Tax=Haemophilus parahaemolyticus TaxID=735 RepID=UPI0028E51DD0
MNKIFKVIWNKTTQRLEVVSELARGAVKSSSNSVVNLAKDLSKPVLKLSLLSICLGYPTWVMAETNTDDGRFGLHRNGNLYLDKNNGKYILGVYDASTGSFGFGKAQVGTKGEVFQNGKMIKPAAVGNFQLAIGHDTLIASGYKGIAIGSNYDSSASDGRREYYFSTLDGRQGGTQGAYAISLGSGAQAIGRHTLALGANSGNGGAYNGYDDAVFLGSLSRIQSVGQGRENDNINVNNLETKYTDAVKEYNNSQTQDALNKVIEAGRNINNAALNKVEGMTIKSNVVHPTQTGKFTTQDQQVSQVNGSCGTTTVSILSVGGKDGNNTMYRQIQNVAAGRIASDSNDAVTGSQLYYVRNYTGWNIGHYDDVTRANTTTGRVNNDHTVIFKPGNYTDVWTSLDSTNRSTVNIEVKTANLGTEVANGKISKIIVTDPIGTDANNTVARTAGVKSVLDKFNEIKADKVDIMGYSHVNETDANNVTENRITTAKTWENQFDNNNGTYRESAGAKGNRAITSGVRANALANDSIAIGSLANVNNNWGSQSVAAERSIAIGREATVNAGQDSIAMGSGAQILHSDATTLNANNAIAIGKLAKVDQASNAIALGNNASIGGNYASNGVWKASDNSIAIGNHTTVSRENSVGIGTNVSVARENSVVIGQEAKATRERVVAIGAYATVNGDRAVAIGPEATANGSKSIVIGGIGDAKAIAEKEQAIVIGNGAQATDNATYSITLGNNAKTAGATGISIGDRAQVVASAANGIALGQSAVANNSGDIAIGQSSSTSTKHTVSDIKIGDATLSKGVAATDNGTVSFGNNNVKRQIQNVGAGEISATSSDVITGSQLYHVIKAADEIAKTEYNFQVNGKNIKTMRNNSTSAANNAHNTLDFKAGDGLDVAYENNAVTYKLNADSKQAITDAKTAAQTVTTKLNEIDQSVQRAETAATNAASSATVASTAAKVAISSASAASSSATAASTSASAANSSATAASTSASAANSSATAASTSASAANSSATAASTSASAANSSATAASTSASAANSSATAASTSASAANSSATAASTSASA